MRGEAVGAVEIRGEETHEEMLEAEMLMQCMEIYAAVDGERTLVQLVLLRSIERKYVELRCVEKRWVQQRNV